MNPSSLTKAFFWSAVERFGQQFAQFGISVILARLLAPAEYGLIGMLTIFFALAGVFADGGLSAGLIQRKEISADDQTSVFYLNLLAGVVLMLLLCAAAPLVARFYRQPILRPLLCVLSLQLPIAALGIVQYALLQREVDFKTQAVISTTATLISGGVGIAMAVRGYGVWSLVSQGLMRLLLNNTLIWLLRPWRPTGRFRWASLRALWPYSSRLLASSLLNAIFENGYALIIGRLYRPADLGHYTRASSLAQLPAASINGIVGRVMFPVFSRLQDEKARLKTHFRRMVRALAILIFPAMAGMAAVAEPLVKCLLTEKWLPCVPYLRILCCAAMLYPLHVLHLSVLSAQGRSDLFFRLEVIKVAMTAAMLAATFRLGVMAMVWGYLALGLAAYVVNAYYTCKLIGYGWGEQGRDLLPILGAALLTGAMVWSLAGLDLGSDWLLLGVQILAGVGAYGLLAFAGRRGTYADMFAIGGQVWRKIVPAMGD